MLKREDLKVGMRVAVEDLYGIPETHIVLGDLKFEENEGKNWGTIVAIEDLHPKKYIDADQGYLMFYLPYEQWLERQVEAELAEEEDEEY